MIQNIEKHKKNIVEIIVLSGLFILLAIISYYQVEQSISLLKYLFVYGIRSLLDNYSLYQYSFQDFLFRTSAFHTGDSESGWRTLFYLWPLFIFCNFLGGLSLKATHLFTITSSLAFVCLFYFWIRKVWGKQVALYASFFLAFSSVFQEIARSGSYDVYSLLIGMIWIIFFFYCSESGRIRSYFLLGLLTGLTWYGYGILRYLTVVVIARIMFLKGFRKVVMLGVLLAGMMIVLVPGILIKFELKPINLAAYDKPGHELFFDQNASFKNDRLFKVISSNFGILGKRILGGEEVHDRPMKGVHASFWNSFLAIPLLIGIWTVLRSQQQLSNRLLLLLAIIIYLAPCFLCNHGIKSRRVLLYIIPSYCFIGLGVKEIIGWVNKIVHIILKRAVVILLVAVLFIVLFQEMAFFSTVILSSQRDVGGFLAFADKIKQSDLSGDMYYLDGPSTLQYGHESDAMRLVLMGKRHNALNFERGTLRTRVPFMFNNFYLSKSPKISEQEFDDWCARNRLKTTLVLEAPVVNSARRSRKSEYFRLYTIQRMDK
ncbi:MAG: hypothetical protein HQL21_05930 [Candidatus Omnitrophica bacterium]|nr:hypothetical protein [Candidatus Omnitrophota bacterium]